MRSCATDKAEEGAINKLETWSNDERRAKLEATLNEADTTQQTTDEARQEQLAGRKDRRLTKGERWKPELPSTFGQDNAARASSVDPVYVGRFALSQITQRRGQAGPNVCTFAWSTRRVIVAVANAIAILICHFHFRRRS